MTRRRPPTMEERIFDLEHQLEIGGHNDGYVCLQCWRQEDEQR
jgi:hypothetical protein